MKVVSDSSEPAHGSDRPRVFIDPNAVDVEAYRAQAERMASLGAMAAGVAHEINNPLAYVLGSLELGLRELHCLQALLQQSASAENSLLSSALCALTNARDGAERVRTIVRDLANFSRAGQPTPEAVDIEAVLDVAVRMAWNEIRHRARLVKRYAGVSRVIGDQARLGQVFLNLLMNAAQAIEGDSESNAITIATRAQAGSVVIEVSDTGSGMAPEQLPHVFEPFYTTKAAGAGVGLGLAICHGIVTGLGGQISVSSQQGRGSTFSVVLPFAPEGYASRRTVLANRGEAAAAPSRILVVDDEPLLGQTLLYAFKGRHEVVICNSGRDALSRLAADARFDLVLCDLMMPDVSGSRVYEEVLHNHPDLVRRFVFMTGGAFTDRAREFLASHPGIQLEKPFKIDEIDALLRQFAALR